MKTLTALTLPTFPVCEWPDNLTPGLLFRVGYRSKTWEVRTRKNGARQRVRVGYYPAMGLLDARNAAKEVLKRIEAGAPAVAAPVVHPKHALSLGALIDQYEKLQIKGGASGRSFVGGFRAVRSGLADYLSLPAKAFTKADLRACRDVIGEKAPYAANRFLAYCGPILRWAASEDLVDHNPVPDLKKYKEQSRDRVLSRDEIARIWKACGELDGGPSARSYGRLVRFALLSLQRLDEVASLKFGHIIDTNLWRQSVNKTNRENRLRLPRLALDLIGSGEAQDYCFAGVSGKISGYSKLKAKLDELSGTGNWRIHDLRRSGASMTQELHISQDVIQGVLGHAVSGVGGVYLRAQMEQAKAAALVAWASEIERIVGKRRGEIHSQ